MQLVNKRLFEGRLADLLSHLLATREVSQEELCELERLIAERKKHTAANTTKMNSWKLKGRNSGWKPL